MNEVDTQIVLLVASQSGMTEYVADELQQAIRQKGLSARVIGMDKVSLSVFDQSRTFIICSSTYGSGDVPDNGRAFCDALSTQRPSLSRIRYGLVALGDMTFEGTFCGGGRKFDDLLSALGATRIGEGLFHDAKYGDIADRAALDWLETWLPKLQEVDELSKSPTQ